MRIPVLSHAFRNPFLLFLESVAVFCEALLLLLAATSRSPLTKLDAIALSISAVTILIGLFRVWVLVEWSPEPTGRWMQMEFTFGGYYNIILLTVLLTAIKLGPPAPYTSLVGPFHPASISGPDAAVTQAPILLAVAWACSYFVTHSRSACGIDDAVW